MGRVRSGRDGSLIGGLQLPNSVMNQWAGPRHGWALFSGRFDNETGSGRSYGSGPQIIKDILFVICLDSTDSLLCHLIVRHKSRSTGNGPGPTHWQQAF